MKKSYARAYVILALALAGCMGGQGTSTQTNTVTKDSYTVGVSQLVQHPALDAATQGFVDTLQEEFGDKVTIDVKNASGQTDVCSTIANQFVTDRVDLIMANATPALQSVAAATNEIPVLGTSITEYGVALDLDNFNGTVGTNISGTSDLAPLDEQAALFDELLPDAKTIGILYCSSEANSKYQVEVVKAELEKQNKTVNLYPFNDSNDVSTFTTNAVNECDALYIPTDNTAASCTETINNIALPAGVPIIAGEENTCKGCGLATLSIDYYELGKTTGKMAIEILKNGKDVKTMPIEYYTNPVKKYNADIAAKLNIEIPSDFKAVE